MSKLSALKSSSLAALLGLSSKSGGNGVSQLIKAADDANRNRDWAAAEAGYARALAINEDLDHIWVQYGHSLKEQGQLEKAEQAYRRALALRGDSADTFLQLGHVLKLREQKDAAALAYRQAYQLDPTSEPVRVELLGDVARPLEATREEWKDERWFELLNAAEFRAMHPDLAAGSDSKDALAEAFLLRGIDRLAAISFDLGFDPAFYREQTPEASFYSDGDAYRHWLFKGLRDNRPGSPSQRIMSLIGFAEFPANLDLARYRADVARKNGPRFTTDLEAIEHLLDKGFEAGHFVRTTSETPRDIYDRIANYLHSAGRHDAAIAALSRAISHDPQNALLHHKLGDYQFNKGDLDDAERSYKRALGLGSRSIWTVLHLIEACLRRSEFAAASSHLRAGHGRFAGERLWRDQIGKVIAQDFEFCSKEAVSLLNLHLFEQADDVLNSCLDRITANYQVLDGLPARAGHDPAGHVVMLSLLTVPQCRHYRVEQRCQQFDEAGIPYELFGGHQSVEARAALLGARALLIYREPAFPENLRLILHARAMGIPTYFEIDDLIFDRRYYPDEFQHYDGQISYEGYVGLLYGTALYRYAIRSCDRAITSTTALKRHLEPLVRDGICHVIPNALDARNETFLTRQPDARGKNDELYVFYGSGARAHNRNFNECVAPSLAELLRERPNVRLVIAGYLDLDPVLDPFKQRIIRIDFIGDIDEYWTLLSRVDINIAVLVPGEMNDCKSEIKWLEAAVAGVPSIVSASARYREILRDRHDALLISSNDQWRGALFELVDKPALRRTIGEKARQLAVGAYSLEKMAAEVAAIFGAGSAGDVAVPAPGSTRTRIMIVAVLFPPQTFGGATRVVRDNVDALLDRYGAEFDVAVFTTDFGAAVGSSRIDDYRGIPVFRYSPPLGERAERFYQDEGAADAFERVVEVWKPDVVHFHCIQYLTGSLCVVTQDLAIPYIVTVHDGWWLSRHQFFVDEDFFLRLPSLKRLPADLSSGGAISDMRRAAYLSEQLRKAWAVLSVSESFAGIYRNAGIPNVRAIPNGLSPMFIGLPRKPGRQDGRIRIGHIGGTTLHKGLHLFRAALQANSFGNIEAVVMDHTQEAAFQQATTWGATPVTLVGKIDQKDMVTFYRTLDVLIVPSIWPESYGLVSREALACGLWVIASDLGAVGEDVVDGKNGFVVDVGDSRNVARALLQINEHPERFRSPPRHETVFRSAEAQVDELAPLYAAAARSAPVASGTAAGLEVAARRNGGRKPRLLDQKDDRAARRQVSSRTQT